MDCQSLSRLGQTRRSHSTRVTTTPSLFPPLRALSELNGHVILFFGFRVQFGDGFFGDGYISCSPSRACALQVTFQEWQLQAFVVVHGARGPLLSQFAFLCIGWVSRFLPQGGIHSCYRHEGLLEGTLLQTSRGPPPLSGGANILEFT